MSRPWIRASMVETKKLTLNSGSQNSIREVRLGGLGQSEERLKESFILIPHHCTFIDVHCFLNPYELVEPLSYSARRIADQQGLYAVQIETSFCGSVFGVLQTQLTLSHRNNVDSPISRSR